MWVGTWLGHSHTLARLVNMFRLMPSSGAQLYPSSHWCVDGFCGFVNPCWQVLARTVLHFSTVLKCESVLANTCPHGLTKPQKPSTHQWLLGYSCAPEDGISRNM